METYKAIIPEYKHVLGDLLDLHNETITVLYKPEHYEILYTKEELENLQDKPKSSAKSLVHEKEKVSSGRSSVKAGNSGSMRKTFVNKGEGLKSDKTETSSYASALKIEKIDSLEKRSSVRSKPKQTQGMITIDIGNEKKFHNKYSITSKNRMTQRKSKENKSSGWGVLFMSIAKSTVIVVISIGSLVIIYFGAKKFIEI